MLVGISATSSLLSLKLLIVPFQIETSFRSTQMQHTFELRHRAYTCYHEYVVERANLFMFRLVKTFPLLALTKLRKYLTITRGGNINSLKYDYLY